MLSILLKTANRKLKTVLGLASLHEVFYINNVMTTIIIIVHIIVSLALIMIVLLQHGKGAGIGAAFGGSSQTVFGSTGAAPFLAKLTAVAAILFMVTSLGLTFLGRQKDVSVMKGAGKPPVSQTVPAAPAKPEAPPAVPAPENPPAPPAK
jgi:preprotein translocase subunit SecG